MRVALWKMFQAASRYTLSTCSVDKIEKLQRSKVSNNQQSLFATTLQYHLLSRNNQRMPPSTMDIDRQKGNSKTPRWLTTHQNPPVIRTLVRNLFLQSSKELDLSAAASSYNAPCHSSSDLSPSPSFSPTPLSFRRERLLPPFPQSTQHSSPGKSQPSQPTSQSAQIVCRYILFAQWNRE